MEEATGRAGYLALAASGELARRAVRAQELLAACEFCPRNCRVNRLAGSLGICRTGALAVVASCSPHFGEEAPLVGEGGSGAIFFSHCSLGCVFCQNYGISHLGEGIEVRAGQLAAMMVSLERQGCHNINLVTPSHVVAQILAALPLAVERGLTIPLVYNSSGYETLPTLELLDGVVDIYLPDFKFWEPASARRFCGAADYPERARSAVREMYRQVGDLMVDGRGIARHGLLVRHLVMPEGLAETGAILRFLAEEISPRTYVNVMDQYHPCGRAAEFPPLARPLSREEYDEALRLAAAAGLSRLDDRDLARFFRSLGFL